jgi:hypothetical protein
MSILSLHWASREAGPRAGTSSRSSKRRTEGGRRGREENAIVPPPAPLLREELLCPAVAEGERGLMMAANEPQRRGAR